MPARVGWTGEPEDGRRGDGYADAVRDYRLCGHVARVPVAFVLPADWVAHSVAEVDTRISKPDPCQRRREEHFRLRFGVLRVPYGARQVFDRGAEGLQGEDVRDGVRALVGRAGDGVRGARAPLVVGNCGPRF